MRLYFLLLAVPALFAQPAQTPAPEYAPEGIVPLQSNGAWLLVPGRAVELYGRHLAPEPWCGQNATPPAPYPVELCGVRVTVGARPAGLMFVGPGQINFKVPADVPDGASTTVQVCVRGVCGAPVTMPFRSGKAFLKLRGTAAVHMPVWLDIDAPPPYQFLYPCHMAPWGFDGFQFEVRYQGQPLSPWAVPGTSLTAPYVGRADCNSTAQPSPLPLHLLYHFDRPGVYSVRLARIALSSPDTANAPPVQSDWTEIAVAPDSPSRRDEWLQAMAESVKSAAPDTLVANLIPSLLAWPDDKALAVLLPLLTLPRPASAADRMGNAGQFARYGLAAFPDDMLRRVFPPDQLLNLCPPGGRCRADH